MIQRRSNAQIEAGSLASGLSANSILLNPPWAITLLMPFGLIDFPISRLVWLIISTLLIIIILTAALANILWAPKASLVSFAGCVHLCTNNIRCWRKDKLPFYSC